jgi:integrase
LAVYNEKNKSKWTKDGRHWYFRKSYRSPNGKIKYYKSKRFLTKQEAEQEELLYVTKRDSPTLVKFNIIAMDYFKNLNSTRKQSTVYSYTKDYNNHILPYFESLYINDINISKVKNWALQIEKKGISVSYMNKIYNILCNIFDYAIKNYNIKENPVRLYGPFQEKKDKIIKDEDKLRYITYDEFNTFISVIDNQLWKTFFTFAYYTGCRRGEIIALTYKDIDFKTNEISINKTLYEEVKGKTCITSTKNNLNRKIKMSKTLRECLLEYKKTQMEYADFSESWFLFGGTRYLPKTTIARYKHKYFELSGVHEITMHEFRHSHVSLLINEYVKTSKEKNMKVDTAKFFLMMSNRMGHTIQVMQNTYMHLFPTIQDEIVDLLDNL